MMMQSANGRMTSLAGQFKEIYSLSSVRRRGRMKSSGLLRK
jgi:hypothetical protein